MNKICLTYGSVCSGIEAASVAWEPLGMRPLWFSEIEKFPSEVLAHHWPHVPNLGDMTAIAARIRSGEIEAPDVLVGGTPCQAFSVAGVRAGLLDPRGQLTISFGDLADAIDARRTADGKPEAIITWENVPGVLSDKTNAFGAFLGLLASESCELQPPGGKWKSVGCVLRGKRAIAWRILDAQYFGVAQRRRRVFLIASARKDFNPASVLFEFDSVRRDSAPSREAGKEIASDAGKRPQIRSHWDGVENPHPTLSQSHNTGGIGQSNQEIFSQRGAGLVSSCGDVGRTLLGKPNDSLDHTLNTYICTFDRQSSGEYGTAEVASTMSARDFKGATDLVMSIHGTQDPDVNEGFAHTLGRNSAHDAQSPAVKGDGCLTLWDSQQKRIYSANAEYCPTLSGSDGGGGRYPPAFAFHENTRGELRESEMAGTLSTGGGKPGQGYSAVREEMQVRRLTPTECERLQGFPDGHTLIPEKKRKKLDDDVKAYLRLQRPELSDDELALLCTDGPRYKALGNSMAVPVMRWIGERIQAELASKSWSYWQEW